MMLSFCTVILAKWENLPGRNVQNDSKCYNMMLSFCTVILVCKMTVIHIAKWENLTVVWVCKMREMFLSSCFHFVLSFCFCKMRELDGGMSVKNERNVSLILLSFCTVILLMQNESKMRVLSCYCHVTIMYSHFATLYSHFACKMRENERTLQCKMRVNESIMRVQNESFSLPV